MLNLNFKSLGCYRVFTVLQKLHFCCAAVTFIHAVTFSLSVWHIDWYEYYQKKKVSSCYGVIIVHFNINKYRLPNLEVALWTIQ